MLTRRALAGMTGLALTPALARAAGDPFPEEMQPAWNHLFKEGRYVPLWRLAKSSQESAFRDAREQWCAFVGDEAAALGRAGKGNDPRPELAAATAEPALTAIVRASRGRRIVMLNEAHTCSRHRHFLVQMLRALRKEGFTHLAAETFASNPPVAAKVEGLKAGDPLTLEHGYYIADPVYAEAVREALELGYRLVPYEEREDQMSPSRVPAERIPVREQAQADNLAAALRRWPGGRFVVSVGYGHLDERDEVPNGPWFAARLKKVSGLDPLTFQQAASGSFGPHAPDGPITQAVLQRFRPRAPIIVTPSPAPSRWGGDLSVFHPSLPDVDGRPGWLAADPKRRRVRIDLPAAAEDATLVQAIHAADPDPAIPADQYLLPPGARQAVLLLRPGRYRLRLETQAGFAALGEVRA
jgi:hypothetical protein